LLTLSLVVSGALLEFGVRILLGPQVKFPRRVVGAPWGLRINEPGAVYSHHSPDVHVRFRINGQGMRADRDFRYEKPPGIHRILSLGDSFTVGYEVESSETFSSVLEQTLERKGRPVEVLNTGVSGFSTAEAYLYLERELWKYQPDLVLLSFYVNDIVDNVRTGLFALRDDGLIPLENSYVPGGGLGDYLNTNMLFSLLSEHSDGFSLFKEKLTYVLKRRMVERSLARVTHAAETNGDAASTLDAQGIYEESLAAALLDAVASSCRERGVPLVIHSIPYEAPGTHALVDALPARFNADQPGVVVLRAAEVLAPNVGRELLYWKRSHYHWTPLSHRIVGEALADLIESLQLLD
jgi:hypothetical protein